MKRLSDQRPPARYQPSVGLSLLFTPLPKGAQRPVLDVSYALGSEHILRFSAREALGVPEQTLLLALLELAGEQYADCGDDAVVSAADDRSLPGRLWSALYPEGGLGMPKTVMIRTTWEALNRRCGTRSGGSTIEMRKAGLRRLCEVVVWEEHSGCRTTRQSFLLVWVEGDDRHIHLALNHRLASVFFGGQYAKLWMCERLRLGSDLAMHVHAFLSTTMRPGASLSIGLDTLAARVWPTDHDSAPAGTLRRRRSELKRALAAIARLSHWTVLWEVGVSTSTKAVIRRAEGNTVRDMTSATPPFPSSQLSRSQGHTDPTVASDTATNVCSLFASGV
ncbi:replication protein C, IncQ-type [Hydrogenophaga atypica]|uniref:Replication protein C, IncQ-type n=1 Tax=Hydrogenophaga atypica TaxID=249409 RepID=A0ABW2QQA5_9BURK